MKKALLLMAAIVCLQPQSNLIAGEAYSTDTYNLVWTSPSEDYYGSMPIGNGDLAANVWVEPTGDLIFYVSKSDAFTGGGPDPELLKLGRVRVKLDPSLYREGADFRQELDLKTGSITIDASVDGLKRSIRFWIDANRPVVHVDIESSEPCTAEIALESWRAEGKWLRGGAQKDVILPSDGQTVRWYQRNVHSIFKDTMDNQHMGEFVDEFHDPLMHRTFGGLMVGEGLKAKNAQTLVTSEPARNIVLSIHALTAQTETPEEWLAQLEQQRQIVEAVPIEKAWPAHVKWWQDFWQRSWIHVTSAGESVDAAVPSMIPSNTLNFRFGVTPGGGGKFQGKLGRMSIVKRALSEVEIKELAGRQSGGTGLKPEDILFSSTPVLHSEIKDSAGWTDSPELTFEIWINPDAVATPARILDKTLPGNDAGFLLDTYPGNGLRLIAGEKRFDVPDCLKAGEWSHVAVAVDAHQERMELYLNGKRIAGNVGQKKAIDEAFEASQAYNLQRWVQAGAGRGSYPIKFNGSLFTVDGVDAFWKFPEGNYAGPDYARWGGPYWFQNTRLIYWPMLKSGDYDHMKPLFALYRNMLPLLKERTRKYFGHDGVFFSETTQIWGLNRNTDFGIDNPGFYPNTGYMRYNWDCGLELSTMLLDYYRHTQDDSFVKETLLPIADQVVLFYDQHYQRTPDGKLHVSPSQALETWHVAEDPVPVLAGLRVVLPGLIALPESLTTGEQRERWKRFLGEVKELPTVKEAGKKWVKPAHVFSDKRNAENPEMYSVFPYRIYGIGKPDLEIGRETYARRSTQRTGGWQQDAIQAALLGLTDQAKADLLKNVTTVNPMGQALEQERLPESRFPAFWGPNFDWVPDQTHASIILTTLQFMLMQTDDEKIFLLPAWPKEWNADFKLHAPYNTTVEGRVENGEVADLKVTPESRAKDVVVMNTAAKASSEPVIKTFIFKTVGDASLEMKIYYPPGWEEGGKMLPAAVLFFGGGWYGGETTQFREMAPYLARRSMIVITPEYRTINEHKITPAECLADAKSAMRFVYKNAARLGIDDNRVAAGGISAGGHLAAATAFSQGFDAPDDDLQVTCKPSALVLFVPVIDNGPGGFAHDQVKNYWEKFSPMHNISANPPPTLFMVGDSDQYIPLATARKYQAETEKNGGRCDLIIYENSDHAFNFSPVGSKATTQAMDDFLVSLGYLNAEDRRTGK